MQASSLRAGLLRSQKKKKGEEGGGGRERKTRAIFLFPLSPLALSLDFTVSTLLESLSLFLFRYAKRVLFSFGGPWRPPEAHASLCRRCKRAELSALEGAPR